MAEIYVKDGETKEEVARRLLDQAENPDHVVWQPRSGVEATGVFVVPDDEVEALVARVEAKRQAETERTEAAIARADERDKLADRTGLTPGQLGFAANAPGDPGSFPVADVEGDEGDTADDDEPDSNEDGPKDPEAPADGEPATDAPTESRAEARRRAAKEKKAADAAAQSSTTPEKE